MTLDDEHDQFQGNSQCDSWHLQDPKREHNSGQHLFPQGKVQPQDKGDGQQHDPEVYSNDDKGTRPEDTVGTDTSTPATAVPGLPEIVDRRAPKYYGKVEGDAASDDENKAKLDQSSCYWDVAEHSVVEEEDR